MGGNNWGKVGSASFDGQVGKCGDRPGGGFQVLFGGGGGNGNDGHGHLSVNEAGCVDYWRDPSPSGSGRGQVHIDSLYGIAPNRSEPDWQ